MTWLSSSASGDIDDVFALRPNLAEDYRAFEAVFRTHKLLPMPLLELVRLRIAQLHRCTSELTRVIEGVVQPDERDGEKYRACIDLAELFVMDPNMMTDEHVTSVREILGDAGTVALMEVCALYDGYCRFQLMLGVK